MLFSFFNFFLPTLPFLSNWSEVSLSCLTEDSLFLQLNNCRRKSPSLFCPSMHSICILPLVTSTPFPYLILLTLKYILGWSTSACRQSWRLEVSRQQRSTTSTLSDYTVLNQYYWFSSISRTSRLGGRISPTVIQQSLQDLLSTSNAQKRRLVFLLVSSSLIFCLHSMGE